MWGKQAQGNECIGEALTCDWGIPAVHVHICVRMCVPVQHIQEMAVSPEDRERCQGVLSCYSLPYSLEVGRVSHEM